MPYIKKERRDLIDADPLNAREPGELNYVFTKYLIKFWNAMPRYSTLNLMSQFCLSGRAVPQELQELVDQLRKKVGVPLEEYPSALRMAFFEFYRRVGGPYEDHKAKKNGDVYAGVPFADGKNIPKTKKEEVGL